MSNRSRSIANSRATQDRITADLAILGALLKPGEKLTAYDIADVIGVTHQAIDQTEKRALRKIRKRLSGFPDLATYLES